MDDLSYEEDELEDIICSSPQGFRVLPLPTDVSSSFQNMHIHNRQFNFLIPIGCVLTHQEEKNDSNQDLNASMEDLDDDGVPDSEDNNDEDIRLDDLDDDPNLI
jgi:hypothetical protein